ncbi:unnamed protein product [Tuber melanosporum]|uniref:(Perigord truffle) hypothetical protein n=1 Tax=Tuber melanosporum (strain Mel28) TaxID=656061 RepID=D5G5H5_TUBMM|nr:uncharacterized protein GSTUM_00004337001 [Tuber melanosporum]CAZ79768.1 unnamed protein product [Tuber melanosporum]
MGAWRLWAQLTVLVSGYRYFCNWRVISRARVASNSLMISRNIRLILGEIFERILHSTIKTPPFFFDALVASTLVFQLGLFGCGRDMNGP